MSDDLIRRLKSGVATKAQVMGGFTIDIPATQAMLSEAADTLARQQALLDRALKASFDDKARADRAEAEVARLREALADPRVAARIICDEILQKPGLAAAKMRMSMIKATLGVKVPALTSVVRWQVVNEALQALARAALTPKP